MSEITFSQVIQMMLFLATAAMTIAASCGGVALLWTIVFLVFRVAAWVDSKTNAR